LLDNKEDAISSKVIYIKTMIPLDLDDKDDPIKGKLLEDSIYYIDIIDGDISATDIASYMAVLADNSTYYAVIKAMLDTRVGYYYDASVFLGLMLNTSVNYALIIGIL
jgi:hypothetical protein